jgi:pimeloyl-ACP methyl ester carboxylesterase
MIDSGQYYRAAASGMVNYIFFHARQPVGPTVLFLHGTGNDALYLAEPLFTSLLEAGFDIFSFDLDGHGRDSTTMLKSTELLSAPHSAFEQLQQLKPQSHHLYSAGFSLGAILGYHATATQSVPISKLAMIGAPFQLNINFHCVWNELRTPFYKPFGIYVRDWGLRHALPGLGPLGRRRFPIRLDGTAKHHDYVNTIAKLLNHVDWNQLRLPDDTQTIAYYGEDDVLSAPDHTRQLIGTQPNCQIEIIPGCNHFLSQVSPYGCQAITEFFAGKNR